MKAICCCMFSLTPLIIKERWTLSHLLTFPYEERPTFQTFLSVTHRIYSTLIQMASWILCRAIVISVTFYWNIRYRSNEIFQRESKGSAFKFLLNSNTDNSNYVKKTLVILLFLSLVSACSSLLTTLAARTSNRPSKFYLSWTSN